MDTSSHRHRHRHHRRERRRRSTVLYDHHLHGSDDENDENYHGQIDTTIDLKNHTGTTTTTTVRSTLLRLSAISGYFYLLLFRDSALYVTVPSSVLVVGTDTDSAGKQGYAGGGGTTVLRSLPRLKMLNALHVYRQHEQRRSSTERSDGIRGAGVSDRGLRRPRSNPIDEDRSASVIDDWTAGPVYALATLYVVGGTILYLLRSYLRPPSVNHNGGGVEEEEEGSVGTPSVVAANRDGVGIDRGEAP